MGVCDPITDMDVHNWLGFREEFLSNKYIELCKIIKTVEGGEIDGKSYHPHCLLHFGEFVSSTDSLNSNLFFKMAKSEFVDHLVMDSNMALFGSPSSPSIVKVNMRSEATSVDRLLNSLGPEWLKKNIKNNQK